MKRLEGISSIIELITVDEHIPVVMIFRFLFHAALLHGFQTRRRASPFLHPSPAGV